MKRPEEQQNYFMEREDINERFHLLTREDKIDK